MGNAVLWGSLNENSIRYFDGPTGQLSTSLSYDYYDEKHIILTLWLFRPENKQLLVLTYSDLIFLQITGRRWKESRGRSQSSRSDMSSKTNLIAFRHFLSFSLHFFLAKMFCSSKFADIFWKPRVPKNYKDYSSIKLLVKMWELYEKELLNSVSRTTCWTPVKHSESHLRSLTVLNYRENKKKTFFAI